MRYATYGIRSAWTLAAAFGLAACEQPAPEPEPTEQPRLSRGGYLILPDEEIDEIAANRIETIRFILDSLQNDGDPLTEPRTIEFYFHGTRDDLEAFRADDAFKTYRSSDVVWVEPENRVGEINTHSLVLELTAVPSAELLGGMERPHIVKAMEYDVFYEGLSVDRILPGETKEGSNEPETEYLMTQGRR